jgi:Glycosyl transferase family 2/Tetratricopeptide repeat
MIVRDEERTIGRVLAQASEFCDEMIVVDTGSTDGTRGIAERAGAKVLDFEWIDDFSAARQYSWDACTGDWVMWLDADDVITPDARAAYQEVKQKVLSDSLDSVWAPYRYHFDPQTGLCTYAFDRERLVRRVDRVRWAGVVHEVLIVPGDRKIARNDLYIEHRPHPERGPLKVGRNLAILERAVAAGDRTPRTLFYFANELRDNGRHAEAIDVYRDYLSDPGPWWEAYAGEISLAKCAFVLGRDSEATESLHAAIRRDSSRAEAYMLMGRWHYDRKEWQLAIPYYAAATSCQRPTEGFVQEADYSWAGWDFLGVCLANAGRHEEAIDATLRSLKLGNPERDRLKANLRWSIDQL